MKAHRESTGCVCMRTHVRTHVHTHDFRVRMARAYARCAYACVCTYAYAQYARTFARVYVQYSIFFPFQRTKIKENFQKLVFNLKLNEKTATSANNKISILAFSRVNCDVGTHATDFECRSAFVQSTFALARILVQYACNKYIS